MLLTSWLSRLLSRTSSSRGHRAKRTRSSRRAEMLEQRTLLTAPNPFDLNTLDGTNGFRIPGVQADGASGYSVSGAGDVNGDGFDDLIIGAPGETHTAQYDGAAYVLFGRSGGFSGSIDLTALDGAGGFRIALGHANGDLGTNVSGVGDINGDGFDDLSVAGRPGDDNEYVDASTANIVLGRPTFPAVLALDGFTLEGGGDVFYYGIYEFLPEEGRLSVSGAGDFNGDGFGDLVVGDIRANQPYADDYDCPTPGQCYAYAHDDAGEAYVVFGRGDGFPDPLELDQLDGTDGVLITGRPASGARLGFSVSPAGDLDGDGLDDVVIGSPFDGMTGAAYVIYGTTAQDLSPLAVEDFDGTSITRLVFGNGTADTGVSVSGGGDVNGDGLDDLIIASPGTDNQAGATHVVFGRSRGLGALVDLSLLDGTNGFRLDGIEQDQYAGRSVSGGGDVNGDGLDDLLIGSPATYAANEPGESFVVFGRTGGFASAFTLSSVDGNNGFRIPGLAANDNLGISVSFAGDINADGFDDVIIGANRADPSGMSSAGETYVVFGGNFTGGAETQVGGPNADTLTASQGAMATDILIGAANNDTLISDGGPDVLRGGNGDDVIRLEDLDFQLVDGGRGKDTLVLANSVDTFDFDPTNIEGGPARGMVSGIEVLDMRGVRPNGIELGTADVRSLTGENNALRILGDASDQVKLFGFTFTGFQPIDGQVFAVYTADDLTVEVLGAASLDSIDPSAGFEIDDYAQPDSGTKVAFGDLNGDGFDDAVIATDGYYARNSEVLVRFGNGTGDPPAELSIVQSTPSGEYTQFGQSLGIGDVNGDGLDDLVIGSSKLEFPFITSRVDEAFVVYGRTSFPTQLDVTALTPADGFRILGAVGLGEPDVYEAAAVSSGDLNGDGIDDIVFDSRDETFVVFGRTAGFDADIQVTELGPNEGLSISGEIVPAPINVGDLDGDGFVEFATRGLDGGEETVFVLDGAALSNVTAVDLQQPFAGFRVDGIMDAAHSISTAGDINGDGFGDLAIVVRNSGEMDDVHIIFGSETHRDVDVSMLDGTDGFDINGDEVARFCFPYDCNSGSSFGATGAFERVDVSGGGDINGDGFDDLLLGIEEAGRRGYDSDGYFTYGHSFVLFGRASVGAEVSLNDEFGTGAIRLEDNTLYSGQQVAVGGDINGDGFDDLLIGGGTRVNRYLGDTTESVAVFGGNFTGGLETQVGDSGDNTLTATQGSAAADVLIGAQGNDILIGDGGPDVLRGGAGDDILAVADLNFRRIDGGSGFDTLRFDTADAFLNLGQSDPGGTIITGIEAIDLRGSGANSLELTSLRLPGDTGRLRIFADADDHVTPFGTHTGYEVIDGLTFAVYTSGNRTLQIQSRVYLAHRSPDTAFEIQNLSYGPIEAVTTGDINGDGFDDVLAGPLGTYAYAQFVVFGREAGRTDVDTRPEFFGPSQLTPEDGFQLVPGSSVRVPVGNTSADVNGDGIDDLIVGVDGFSTRTGPGEVFVLFGRTQGLTGTIELDSVDGTNGFRIAGEVDSGFVDFARLAAGDFNGDGLADILLATPNAPSYVVFGSPTPAGPTLDVADIDGTNGVRIDGATNLRNAGDVNGDGIQDIAVQRNTYDFLSRDDDNESTALILFGRTGGFGSMLDLDALSAADGFQISGLVDPDSFLTTVGLGDINGDGFSDIGFNISTLAGDSSGDRAGVVFGRPDDQTSNVDLSALNGAGFDFDATGLSIFCSTGLCQETAPGTTVASGNAATGIAPAGDINGDGFDDVLVEAAYTGQGYDLIGDYYTFETSGQAFVIYGRPSFPDSLALNGLPNGDGLVVQGRYAGTLLASSHAVPGDVNGDGFDDVTFYRPNEDQNTYNRQEATVLYGANLTGQAETQVGDGGDNTLSAIQGPSVTDILLGGVGNDQLTSDGGPDALRGGQGNDVLSIVDSTFRRIDGGSNHDVLAVSGFNMTLDLTSIPDNRIVDIETIDLRGNGSNSLTLGVRDALNISSHSNTLTIRRDEGDSVNIGPGWTPEGPVRIDDAVFDRFTQGQATLLVQITGSLTAGPVQEDGELRLIERDAFNSRIEVTRDGDSLMVVVGDGLSDFTTTHTFDLNTVDRLMVMLGDGDSQVDLRDSPIPAEVHAGPGNDSVFGSRFNDVLVGEDGDDMLRGGGGADMIMGGAGHDALNGQSGRDTIMGQSGDDRIVGGSGRDRIEGGDGDDRLNGQSGKDRIEGGPGIDRIVDRRGPTVVFDQIAGDMRVDRLRSSSDRGDSIQVRVMQRLTLNGSDSADRIQIEGFTGAVHFRGNGGNDTLIGGRRSDTLEGGDGDDVLEGRSGNDLLLGDAGNDIVAGEGGRDIVSGGTGDDVINGGGGQSTLRENITGSVTLATQNGLVVVTGGGLGSDTFIGTFDSAHLIGGAGANHIDASDFAGRTTLEGNGGPDTLLGSHRADVIDGGPGDDVINANAGNDAVHGRQGADNINGGTGNDTLLGGGGSDSLTGESGRDLILGESGADQITGGPDRDRLAGGGNRVAPDPADVITGNPRELSEALRFAFDRLLDGV